MDSGQTVCTFEVLDDMPVVFGIGDLWDPEKLDEFLFRHDGGTGDESAVLAWQNSGQATLLLADSHGCSLCFLWGIGQNRVGPKEGSDAIRQFVLLTASLMDACSPPLFLREWPFKGVWNSRELL